MVESLSLTSIYVKEQALKGNAKHQSQFRTPFGKEFLASHTSTAPKKTCQHREIKETRLRTKDTDVCKHSPQQRELPLTLALTAAPTRAHSSAHWWSPRWSVAGRFSKHGCVPAIPALFRPAPQEPLFREQVPLALLPGARKQSEQPHYLPIVFRESLWGSKLTRLARKASESPHHCDSTDLER